MLRSAFTMKLGNVIEAHVNSNTDTDLSAGTGSLEK